MMTEYFEYQGRAILSISHSRENVKLVDQAEVDARRMIDAAHAEHGTPKYHPMSWGKSEEEAQREAMEWWTTVFGDTEEGLEEQLDTLAKRYKRLRFKPRHRKERRAIKHAYIKADAMLTVGHGLSTEWR